MVMPTTSLLMDAIEVITKAIKPPRGYTPIPNSKHGGFHKRVNGKWVTWYPGHLERPHPTERFTHEEHEENHAKYQLSLPEAKRKPAYRNASKAPEVVETATADVAAEPLPSPAEPSIPPEPEPESVAPPEGGASPPDRKDVVALAMSQRGLVLHRAMNRDGIMVSYWVRPETVALVEERGGKWEEASGSSATQDPFKRWAMKPFEGLPYPYEVPRAALTPADAFAYAEAQVGMARVWEKGDDGVWRRPPEPKQPLQPDYGFGPYLTDAQKAAREEWRLRYEEWKRLIDSDRFYWKNETMTALRMGERTRTGEVYAGRTHSGGPLYGHGDKYKSGNPSWQSGPTWEQLHARGWIYVPAGIDPNTEMRSHAEIIKSLFESAKNQEEARQAEIKRSEEERLAKIARAREAAYDTYQWPDGAPEPSNAVHPRMIEDLKDSRYQLWTWDERRNLYRKAEKWPDSGSWLQREASPGQYEWQKALAEHPKSIFMKADEIPIYERPVEVVDGVKLGISVERPPDFMLLNFENIETRKVQNGRFENWVPTGNEEWLHEHGFWTAIDRENGHRGFLASVLIDKARRGETYEDTRSEKVRSYIASAARNLAAWWSDINDDEREYFWEHFCDKARQPSVVRPNDPRHENANFEIPPGMQKFRDKGWRFHDYQKKAINFAADHAPRSLWAEEMGLGKTIQAIGLYHHLKARGEVKQMIVTAPTSAIGSWEDEFTGNSDARVRVVAEATASQRDKAYADFADGKIDVLIMTPYVLGMPDPGDEVRPPKAAWSNAPDGAIAWTKVKLGRTERRTMWKKNGDVWETKDWDVDQSVPTSKLLEEKPYITFDGSEKNAWAVAHLDAIKLRKVIDRKASDILRVADEVHLFKNADAARRRGFEHAFCQPEGRVVGMSGTPKPNGPEDFYTIVNDITRGALGSSLQEFSNRYCYASTEEYGAKKTGQPAIMGFRPGALSELYRDNASFLFARTTQDPDAVIQLKPQIHMAPRLKPDETQVGLQTALVKAMTLLHAALAEEAAARSAAARGQMVSDYSPSREVLNAMADGHFGPLEQLAARKVPWDERSLLIRLKQASIDPSILDDDGSVTGPGGPLAGYESPKMQAVADAAVTHISQNEETGGVLFSTSVGGLYAMKTALVKRGIKPEEIGIIHGGVPRKVREEIRRDLNSGKIKFVIGQTKALNTGANMQARANFVAHIDTPWEPDVLTQSTARVHRQGQKRKVTVFRPMGSDVDALIERRVASKLRANANAMGRMMESDRVALESMVGRGLSEADFSDELGKMLGVSAEVLKPQGERVMTGMRDIVASLGSKGGKVDVDLEGES